MRVDPQPGQISRHWSSPGQKRTDQCVARQIRGSNLRQLVSIESATACVDVVDSYLKLGRLYTSRFEVTRAHCYRRCKDITSSRGLLAADRCALFVRVPGFETAAPPGLTIYRQPGATSSLLPQLSLASSLKTLRKVMYTFLPVCSASALCVQYASPTSLILVSSP